MSGFGRVKSKTTTHKDMKDAFLTARLRSSAWRTRPSWTCSRPRRRSRGSPRQPPRTSRGLVGPGTPLHQRLVEVEILQIKAVIGSGRVSSGHVRHPPDPKLTWTELSFNSSPRVNSSLPVAASSLKIGDWHFLTRTHWRGERQKTWNQTFGSTRGATWLDLKISQPRFVG